MANKWFIAIKKRGEDIFDLSHLQLVDNEFENTYWADPFLMEHEGKEYCFFEWYNYEKGVLGVAEVQDNLGGIAFANPRVILDEEKHLSFPSVMWDGWNYYMTPERVLAGELLVYRAVEFPDVWAVHSRVAMGRYDDPIMRTVDVGKYEIWTTDDNKLRVFYSEDNMQTWRVIRTEDKPYQRSAGHFIGDLRPTQDSVPIYGRAIKFLDPEGKVKHYIEPDWYEGLTGCHTFNVSSKHVVVDGRVKL